MNIPTSTFINLPANFLSNVFAIVGYMLDNFWPLISIALGIGLVVVIISIIFNLLKG